MVETWASTWWTWLIRGALSIIFGLFALFAPGLTLTTLVIVFGAFAFVDGLFAIGGALFGREHGEDRWINLLEGILGVAAGIIAFAYPGITTLTLLYIIAFWAIATGLMEIIAAFRMRKVIDNEFLLGLGGFMSVLFGILIIAFPGGGALAVTWLIGVYAIVFGVVMIALGFRLRDYRQPPRREFAAS